MIRITAFPSTSVCLTVIINNLFQTVRSIINRGNSSVGRAVPCQGTGRRFEPGFPLQFSKLSSLNICNVLTLAKWLRFRGFLIPRTFCFIGWVAEGLCSGLQLRVRRFDSDLSLHFESQCVHIAGLSVLMDINH